MRFHHVGIEVRDLERSIRFYRDVLGLRLRRRLTVLGEEIAFLTSGNACLELVQSSEDPGGSRVHFAFGVDDLQKAVPRLEERGAILAEGPYELVSGWKTAFFHGPDGELFEVIGVPAIDPD
jgi:lactoylglutathione lyase